MSELKFGRRNFLKVGSAAVAAAALSVGASAAAPAVEEENCIIRKKAAAAPEMVLQLDNPLVEVKGGILRGFIDRGITTFRGIPYATAERFGLPQQVAAWNGPKDCYIYGGMCPQDPMTLSAAELLNPHCFWPMEENCQKLNVWTKDTTGKKPVMFWIHGGGYSSGSCIEQPCYDGHNLCANGDVVVVSINHRLNCLGFLDLSAYGDEYKYSGNLGMIDIIAALQWVKNNIAQFGGDPDNVTVFGQSGGGRKILNLMAMPAANGLFHKVIGESCGPSGVSQSDAQKVAELTFAELGLENGDVEALKTMDYDKLRLAATAAQNKATAALGHSVGWFPVIDGDCLPANIWKDGPGEIGKDIPMIIGNVFAEVSTNAFGTVMAGAPSKNSFTAEQVDAQIRGTYGDKADAVIEAFKKAYPNKPIVDVLYVALASYRGEEIEVLKHRGAQGAPTWNYIFSYEFPTLGGLLPWHCSELPFVFGNVGLHSQANGATPEGYKLSEKMLQAWANFAYTGNPGSIGKVKWPAYTEAEGACMMIEPDAYVGYHHDSELRKIALGL